MGKTVSRMIYTSLPTAAKLRVAVHPEIATEWCGYNPNTYSVPVFLKGIFRDIYLGQVSEMKARHAFPWLFEFIETDPEAFLGDAFRHVEVGECFVEKYEEVTGPGQPLGAVSGQHLNIITETDRTIEKWSVSLGHNMEDYASYFKDYTSFTQFMELLEGHMQVAVDNALALVVKAAILADPSSTIFDNKDFSRVFGRTRNNAQQPVPSQGQALVATSDAGTKWNALAQELIQKYYGKSQQMWKNIQRYNPYYYSFDDYYEKMNPLLWEPEASGKDKAKRQEQQLYTDAHEVNNDQNRKTEKVHHLHRNDCLFALFDAINYALVTLTGEKSPEYWLGNDTSAIAYANAEEEAKKHMQVAAQGVEGTPITEDSTRQKDAHVTTASSDDGFEVMADPQNLILIMNKHDFADLKRGIARRLDADVRAVSLDMLRDLVPSIHYMDGMKPGHVRLLDKRAFKIRPYFQMTDIQEPMEKLTYRYKLFFKFAVVMFKNFAGCLFVPSPHFIASSRYYDRYNLIGQKIEPNK